MITFVVEAKFIDYETQLFIRHFFAVGGKYV